jgi:molybdopterin converting factor small subunit
VYAPPFASYEHVDPHGYLEIEDGATLKDLFRKLKMPFAFGAVLFCKVNYDKATLDMKLKDGDVVSFYSPLAGG